jgi:hypothetical protein
MRIANEARRGVHENTVRTLVDRTIEEGLLTKLHRGLYLNKLAVPSVRLAEAAPFIRSGAVVSLQQVLGEFGVSNNPSSAVTCVLPYGPGSVRPSTRDVQTEAGLFMFHALPERFFPPAAGAKGDLFLDRPYPVFCPEKAFLDWLYLGASPRSNLAPPPPDLDFQAGPFDMGKVRRLARELEMSEHLETFLAYQEAMGHGEEHAEVQHPIRRARP